MPEATESHIAFDRADVAIRRPGHFYNQTFFMKIKPKANEAGEQVRVTFSINQYPFTLKPREIIEPAEAKPVKQIKPKRLTIAEKNLLAAYNAEHSCNAATLKEAEEDRDFLFGSDGFFTGYDACAKQVHAIANKFKRRANKLARLQDPASRSQAAAFLDVAGTLQNMFFVVKK